MRILIADDNEMVRSRLAGILLSVANWEVCGQAIDGPDAIEKAVELPPDLILLDICIPGLADWKPHSFFSRKLPTPRF
jgi:chemotaxis response regulator CheB